MTKPSRARHFFTQAALYVGITAATLIAVDLICNVLGLFPPTYEYGNPDVGWVSASPTGRMREDRCMDYATGKLVSYARNEDGIRTHVGVARLRADSGTHKIAVTGDSQTDLCAPNAETHPGVLESELNGAGIRATVLPFGAGRYSPLQDYLVFRKFLTKYGPDTWVLNLYTGNDFYDLLRIDDRPYFVKTDQGYAVAPPVWYLYDDRGVRRHSRVLFALRSLSKRLGVRDVLVRVRFLREMAAEQGEGLGTVIAYMNDLRKSDEPSVGYSAAFAAQMLNQQLFFHRFPTAREESVRRLRALMQLARRENPDILLVMSPLPSYELVEEQPVDSALLRTLGRLPITYESGVEEERELYDTARRLAAESGWIFVDNLTPLRAYHGSERLFNDFDYHLLPVASEIIGKAEAAAIRTHLRTGSPGHQPARP